MSQQYLRLNKKKELEAELKQAKYTLVKEKAKCFKILNDSEPFVPKCGKEAQKVLDDFNSLCEFYGIDPNSFKIDNEQPQSPIKELTAKSPSAKKTPKKSTGKDVSKAPSNQPTNDNSSKQFSQAYHARMQVLIKEENEKRALLDRLNKKLLLLKKQNDDLVNEKNMRVITIDKSFTSLKNKVKELHDCFTDFNNNIKSKIELSKKLVSKIIATKTNKAQTRISKLNEMINQLQEQKNSLVNAKKEKISRLSLQKNDDQSYSYAYEGAKVKKVISQAGMEIQELFESRFKSSKINSINENISKKIDQLNNRISQLTEKVNSIEGKRKQQRSLILCKNWGTLTSSLLKYDFINKALDEYIQELKEEDDDILGQLNKELEIVNGKIPGTNLTILELRKEIVDLTEKLSVLSTSKTDELTLLRNEYEELRKTSQKQIEELEEKLDG